MNKRAIMLITNGFEEIEAVTVIDILRRGGIECDICSVFNTEYIDGAHGIVIRADKQLKDMGSAGNIAGMYDAVILPGGGPNANNLKNNENVINILKAFNNEGKIVAAICAAPMALEEAGLLENKKVTFFPDSIENIDSLNYTEGNVERDGNIITGKAAGTSAEFAFEIAGTLKDKETADRLRTAMFY